MNLYKLYKKLPLKLRIFIRDIYFKKKYGTKDMFVTVDLELNSQCNLKCKYCPNFHCGSRGENYMDWQTIRKIVKELKALDYRGNINTSFYGEPLLRPGLEKIIKYISSELPKALVRVYSNATLLTTDKYEKLKRAGVKEFVLTPHTPAGKSNIDSILLYRKDIGDKTPVKVFDLGWLVNRGGLVPLENVTMKETCISPSWFLAITYTGNVLLCCCDFLEENIMGNVKKERLIDIWRKPAYKKYRDDIKVGKYDLEMCQKCGYIRNEGGELKLKVLKKNQ